MKETPLTREMVERGDLKVGDIVSPTVELVDRTGRYKLLPEQKYPIVSIDLNNPELPASFVVKHPSGETWAFSFDRKGATGQYFVKLHISPEESFFDKYGEIPYFVLQELHQNTQLDLKSLIRKVMSEKMVVEPEKLNSVKKQIEYSISTLEHYGYLLEFEEGFYTLTPKGKEFINE